MMKGAVYSLEEDDLVGVKRSLQEIYETQETLEKNARLKTMDPRGKLIYECLEARILAMPVFNKGTLCEEFGMMFGIPSAMMLNRFERNLAATDYLATGERFGMVWTAFWESAHFLKKDFLETMFRMCSFFHQLADEPMRILRGCRPCASYWAYKIPEDQMERIGDEIKSHLLGTFLVRLYRWALRHSAHNPVPGAFAESGPDLAANREVLDFVPSAPMERVGRTVGWIGYPLMDNVEGAHTMYHSSSCVYLEEVSHRLRREWSPPLIDLLHRLRDESDADPGSPNIPKWYYLVMNCCWGLLREWAHLYVDTAMEEQRLTRLAVRNTLIASGKREPGEVLFWESYARYFRLCISPHLWPVRSSLKISVPDFKALATGTPDILTMNLSANSTTPPTYPHFEKWMENLIPAADDSPKRTPQSVKQFFVDFYTKDDGDDMSPAQLLTFVLRLRLMHSRRLRQCYKSFFDPDPFERVMLDVKDRKKYEEELSYIDYTKRPCFGTLPLHVHTFKATKVICLVTMLMRFAERFNSLATDAIFPTEEDLVIPEAEDDNAIFAQLKTLEPSVASKFAILGGFPADLSVVGERADLDDLRYFCASNGGAAYVQLMMRGWDRAVRESEVLYCNILLDDLLRKTRVKDNAPPALKRFMSICRKITPDSLADIAFCLAGREPPTSLVAFRETVAKYDAKQSRQPTDPFAHSADKLFYGNTPEKVRDQKALFAKIWAEVFSQIAIWEID